MTNITAVTRLKLSAVLEACKKLGSQSALAHALNINPTELGEWVNLQRHPPTKPTRYRDQEWIDELERRFIEHVGCTIDDIWTDELRQAIDSKRIPKSIEKRAEISDMALLSYATSTRARLEYSPENLERKEMMEAVAEQLDKLPFRTAEILRLRYGIRDGRAYSFEEIGHIFKITRERVRQIQMNGERMLTSMESAQKLVGHLD